MIAPRPGVQRRDPEQSPKQVRRWQIGWRIASVMLLISAAILLGSQSWDSQSHTPEGRAVGVDASNWLVSSPAPILLLASCLAGVVGFATMRRLHGRHPVEQGLLFGLINVAAAGLFVVVFVGFSVAAFGAHTPLGAGRALLSAAELFPAHFLVCGLAYPLTLRAFRVRA